MSKTIGERIRELRKHRGFTQRELAEKIGCAQTTVANWENIPTRSPDKEVMGKVAEIFNVTVDYLFGVEPFDNLTIPCYGEVSSRGFTWSDEDHYPLKVASDEYNPNSFALKILDDDLEPFILKDDYAIFSKIAPKDRDIVVVRFPEDKDISMVRVWRCNEDLVALFPVNFLNTKRTLLFRILSQKNSKVKLTSKGSLIIEGVFIGLKRSRKKIS